MIVRVTQDHIQDGKRHLATSCPVALAMKEAGYVFPIVYADLVNWRLVGDWGGAHTSRRARKFILDFDKGKDVHPAVFRFEEFGCSPDDLSF